MEKYMYSIVGGLLALLIGIIFLWLGFLKTLFLIIIIVFGTFIGNQFKDTGILEIIIHKIKNKQNRRN